MGYSKNRPRQGSATRSWAHGSREVRPLTDRRPESLPPAPPELASHSGPKRKRYAVATVMLHSFVVGVRHATSLQNALTPARAAWQADKIKLI
jgi:hypothetical protein